jgi:hypothetical protein
MIGQHTRQHDRSEGMVLATGNFSTAIKNNALAKEFASLASPQ